MQSDLLPVVVIGAGPVGLAAAAHLLEQGEEPMVLESGSSAANVRAWEHVRFFSPWSYVVDRPPAGCSNRPAGPRPTPISTRSATTFSPITSPRWPKRPAHRQSHPVRASRGRRHPRGSTKSIHAGREDAPFRVTFRITGRRPGDGAGQGRGRCFRHLSTPNPLGASGVPAIGETALRDHIFYGIPDVLGRDQRRYAGKRVLVAGSGHSAFNILLDLADPDRSAGDGGIVWAVRAAAPPRASLRWRRCRWPSRPRSTRRRVRELVAYGRLQLRRRIQAGAAHETADGIVVASRSESLPPVDEIIVSAGFRPDLSMLRELRIDLDPGVEAPRRLAPMIDPNLHSCGSVPPHGAEELRHPDPDFYIAGMKSYGRAPPSCF